MPTDFVKFHPDPSGNVIELQLPLTIDAADFDHLNQSMLTLVQGQAKQKWIIDLSAVSYMGSAMLGMLVNVRQKVRAGGGQIMLCGLSKPLMSIFKTCCMERLFTIVKDQKAALSA